MNHEHPGNVRPQSFWTSRYAIGLLVIGGVAGSFLLTEHLAHVVGVLPFLLLLACPLMHLFMHHGHGGHSHHDSTKNEKPAAGSTESGKTRDPS